MDPPLFLGAPLSALSSSALSSACALTSLARGDGDQADTAASAPAHHHGHHGHHHAGSKSRLAFAQGHSFGTGSATAGTSGSAAFDGGLSPWAGTAGHALVVGGRGGSAMAAGRVVDGPSA